MSDQAALLPLKDVLFISNDLTGKKEKLCPACLTYSPESDSNCIKCKEKIPAYDEQSFLSYREKNLDLSVGPKEMGISPDAVQKKDIHELFSAQYSLWNRVYAPVVFMNQISLSTLKLRELGHLFLCNFPLKPAQLASLESYDIDFSANDRESSRLHRKLLDIDRLDPIGKFRDFAFWLRTYLDETDEPSIGQNLSWLNVRAGAFEKNPIQLKEAMSRVAILKQEPYGIEIALSVIHWKYLAEDRLLPQRRYSISKPLYAFLLDQWVPQSVAEDAWRALGLAYTQSQPVLVEKIAKYRDEQLSKAFLDRDLNFLLSYMLIFSDFSDAFAKLLEELPWKSQSFYAPLVSFHKDPSFAEKFFTETASDEGFVRALYFFDFSKCSFTEKVCERALKMFPGKELWVYRKNLHPSLLGQLTLMSLRQENFGLATDLLRLQKPWPVQLADIDLVKLHPVNPQFVEFVVSTAFSDPAFPPGPLLHLLTGLPEQSNLGLKVIQALRTRPDPMAFYLPVFEFLQQVVKNENTSYAVHIRTALGNMIGGQVTLSKARVEQTFKERAKEWTQAFLSLFLSKDPAHQKTMHGLAESHLDLRTVNLDLFAEVDSEELFQALLNFMTSVNLSNMPNLAGNLMLQMLQQGRLNESQMRKLDSSIDACFGPFKETLRLRLKEQPALQTPQSADAPAAAPSSADEIAAELKRMQEKMKEMERALSQALEDKKKGS